MKYILVGVDSNFSIRVKSFDSLKDANAQMVKEYVELSNTLSEAEKTCDPYVDHSMCGMSMAWLYNTITQKYVMNWEIKVVK